MSLSSFYQQHINSISLQQFRSSTVNIFPNALTEPEFFKQNLVSPDRIIKYFPEDSQSNIRVFYYHLLKLSYQVQNLNGQRITEFIEEFKEKVFSQKFQILFSRETEEDRILFNNIQFKRFLDEFLKILDDEKQVSIEKMINTYPIMDIVLIHILRSLMSDNGIDQEFETKIETEVVFNCLSSLLGMGIDKFNKCWKFHDSDMFCLDQNGKDLYFAFIQQNAIQQLNSESDNSIEINQEDQIQETNVLKDLVPNLGYTFGRYQQLNQSSVKQNQLKNNFSETFTRLFSNQQKPSFSSKVQSNIKADLLNLQLSAQKLLSNSLIKPKYPATLAALLPEFSSISQSETSSFGYGNDSRKQSIAYNVMPNRNLYQYEKDKLEREKISKAQTSHLSQVSECDSYIGVSGWIKNENENSSVKLVKQPEYRPYLDFLSKYSSPDQSLTSSNKIKSLPITQPEPVQKIEYSKKKSIYLADYYSDFTNSFLLPILKEPFQSNLRGIKNRIKGSRRQNVNPCKF